MLTPEQREQMPKWVREILGPDKAVKWWKLNNPLLGGATPWQMTLSAWGEKKLYNFIRDAHEANQLSMPEETR